jgi:hypothetical protein
MSITYRADGSIVLGFDQQNLKAYQVRGYQAPPTSYFGLITSGDAKASFSSLFFASSAQLNLKIWGCWQPAELSGFFSALLNVDPSYFSVSVVCRADGYSAVNLNITDRPSSGKRAAVAAPINPATAVSLLSGWISSETVVASTPAVVPAIAAAVAVEVVVGTTAAVAAGTAAGLTAGAIVGIIVGSVVGAAVVTGTVVVGVKSVTSPPELPESDVELTAQASSPAPAASPTPTRGPKSTRPLARSAPEKELQGPRLYETTTNL